MLRSDKVGGLGEYVTCHFFSILVYLLPARRCASAALDMVLCLSVCLSATSRSRSSINRQIFGIEATLGLFYIVL